MDTLTHLVAGALTPLAFKDAPKTRLLIPFGILCGELPDIDILAGTSAEAFLAIHRGVTHSLAAQPIAALAMAAIFHGALKKGDAAGSWTFAKTWLVAFIALMTHLFLDCMTTFGTRIFLPFSEYRVALPSMYIVDLLLTLPILALLITLLFRGGSGAMPFRRQPLAKKGLAWIFIYPLAALGICYASTLWLSACYVDEGNPEGIQRVQLSPEPFAPVNWKVVAEAGTRRYKMASFSLLRPGKPLEFSEYARVDPELWRDLQKEVRLVAMYAAFVSFPVATVTEEPGGVRLLTVQDLRYAQIWRELMEFLGRTDPMFLLQVKLDSADRPLAWRFLRRGNEAADTPWETPSPVSPAAL